MKINDLSSSRRSIIRGAIWSGVSLVGLFAGSSGLAGPVAPALDARPGRVGALSAAEASKFERLAPGKESETFGVSLANGERHLFRVSGGQTGAALVESIGPSGVRKSVSIPEGDSPLPYLQRKQAAVSPIPGLGTCDGFWACFFPCMIGKIGAAIWNNLKNNLVSCWNQAMGKRWWYQKIAKFIGCICTYPYATYAISCFFNCA